MKPLTLDSASATIDHLVADNSQLRMQNESLTKSYREHISEIERLKSADRIKAADSSSAPSAGAVSAGDEQRHARALLSAINNSDFDVPAYDEATCWLESLAAAHPAPQNPKDDASLPSGIRSASSPVVGEES